MVGISLLVAAAWVVFAEVKDKTRSAGVQTFFDLGSPHFWQRQPEVGHPVVSLSPYQVGESDRRFGQSFRRIAEEVVHGVAEWALEGLRPIGFVGIDPL